MLWTEHVPVSGLLQLHPQQGQAKESEDCHPAQCILHIEILQIWGFFALPCFLRSNLPILRKKNWFYDSGHQFWYGIFQHIQEWPLCIGKVFCWTPMAARLTPSRHALAMRFLPWPHTSLHGNQRFVDVAWPSKLTKVNPKATIRKDEPKSFHVLPLSIQWNCCKRGAEPMLDHQHIEVFVQKLFSQLCKPISQIFCKIRFYEPLWK